MNTKHIDYILVVAETKKIYLAAEQQFISLTTLSQIINKIEKQIGFRIFERSSSGITFTIPGKYFVKRLENLNSRYKDLFQLSENLKPAEMELTDLQIQYIIKVSETLSINQAAKKLKLSNCPVATQIKKLKLTSALLSLIAHHHIFSISNKGLLVCKELKTINNKLSNSIHYARKLNQKQ